MTILWAISDSSLSLEIHQEPRAEDVTSHRGGGPDVVRGLPQGSRRRGSPAAGLRPLADAESPRARSPVGMPTAEPTIAETRRHRVVVVGGGITALEFVLALHHLAGDTVELCLIAPDVHFTVRAMSVARPFARGSSGELPLDRFMAEQGGRLRQAAVVRVDAGQREVRCDDGAREPYDQLVLAPGARPRSPYTHALTFGLSQDRDALENVLAELDEGYSSSVAFVVPGGTTWPLPAYELALMTAERLRRRGRDTVRVHLVTPERAPLEAFGAKVSSGVGELLDAAGVLVHLGVEATIEHPGVIEVGGDAQLHVDHVVALPSLAGPSLRGIPRDADGFIPVDAHGRLAGHPGVHAIGDATSGAIKQGGVGSQQADFVAADIAAGLGVAGWPVVKRPLLRGRLLTGRGDRFLQTGESVGDSDAPDRPPWWPAAKIVARHLGPYLERSGLVTLPVDGDSALPRP